jgi:hypothetical protein
VPVVKRIAKWFFVGAGTLLLGLGVQSAWVRVGHWISPPPPPLPQQVDRLIHREAQSGLFLDDQETARLHPGGELSYVFLFKPPAKTSDFSPPSSELRIYDLHHGRLKLRYRLRPVVTFPNERYKQTFGISLLPTEPGPGNSEEVVASLEAYAADAIPAFPVVVRWDAAEDTYHAHPILSGDGKPQLHGDPEWQRGYLRPINILNEAMPAEHFVSYWAEAIQVEGGVTPHLLAIFYATARDRADPKSFEINVWSLRDLGRACLVGRSPFKTFVTAAGFATYEQIMSRAWLNIHAKTFCD